MIRLIICFLVVTLVINAGGWTFNKEAIADVWLAEQHCQAGDISRESEDPQTVSSKNPCNHWCYTVGLFIGLLSPMGYMTLEFANEYSVQQSFDIQFSAPEGRFRPPRLLFQDLIQIGF